MREAKAFAIVGKPGDEFGQGATMTLCTSLF